MSGMTGSTRRSILLGGALLLAPRVALAAPHAEVWTRWLRYDPDSKERIDHSAWAAFLRKYLKPGSDGINRIAYREVGNQDRAALAAYVDALSETSIGRLSRAAQFAFWVNLYNALTMRTVLEHYPAKSIRDIAISPGLFAIGPWGARLVTVEGEALSLDDIEHRILRPIWRDPRVHYAVNCAALGCPNLQAAPFLETGAEQVLERAAADYVNHPRGATVVAGELTVSSIYDWYQEDFGGSEHGVIAHLKRYARPPLGAKLANITRITARRYDWALNDAESNGPSLSDGGISR
jgi:hypothetical protein